MNATTPGRRIALIPGDGIGVEVAASARTVLAALDERYGLDLRIDEFDWSCERYLAEGALMPADGLDTLRRYDAVLLGAVGWPGVPDHVSLWGLLIPIRRAFGQYVNLRPVRSFEGVTSPLADGANRPIDLVIVRENNEGEYSEVGGRFNRGLPEETAIQEAVFTRRGISRIADYALSLAAGRGRHLTSATKSNGLVHSMPFWDEVVRERAALRPEVELVEEHVDALAAKLVLRPESFDVIVASNLFGDILSDLAAGAAGSIGIAPSGNLDPTRRAPLDVRARPRVGSRHRRQRDRQPRGHAVVHGPDAPAPRRPRAGGPADVRDRGDVCATLTPAPRTWAAPRRPSRSPPRSLALLDA